MDWTVLDRALRRASREVLLNVGMTIAARMPRMITTIRISTSVKPRRIFDCRLRISASRGTRMLLPTDPSKRTHLKSLGAGCSPAPGRYLHRMRFGQTLAKLFAVVRQGAGLVNTIDQASG